MDRSTYLHDYSLNWRNRFFDLYDEVRRKPSVGAVHKMRVAVRRLRSVLSLIHSSGKSRFKKLDRELRQLQSLLGACRELDVAIRDAKEFGIDFKHIKSVRKKRVQKLQKKLSPARRGFLERRFGQVLAMIDEAELQPAKNLDQLKNKFLRRAKAHPRKPKKLHRLRISAKKVRYALESIGVKSPELEDLQSAIGRMHDMQTLRKLVRQKRSTLRRAQKVRKKSALKMIQPALTQIGQQAIALN